MNKAAIIRYSVIFIVNSVLLLSQPAYSTIYSWTDKNGKKHFSDFPPPDSETNSQGSQVREFLKTKQFVVPVFNITRADDPAIIGTYIPMYRTYSGLPQYRLKAKDEAVEKEKLPKLFAKNVKGNWQWKIETDYSLYSSGIVQEGVAPHKVRMWKKRSQRVFLSVSQEIYKTSNNFFEYSYMYDIKSDSPGVPNWQKQVFRVSGVPEYGLNGDYYPVNWSSEYPRYKTDNNSCLTARAIGGSWQWNLGDCKRQSYSSSRESVNTMPDQVEQWIKNAGLYVIPIKIMRIAQ